MNHNDWTKDDLRINSNLAGPSLFITHLIQFWLSMLFVLSLSFTKPLTEYLIRASVNPFRTAKWAMMVANK
ncbi:hypothetical protein CEP51_001133 [Fusarium floridanum]|uniref:Uncharacterized protein n=1 Tax=Fusarium floridanum TaxID=1325733 RepID=A0A428SIQ6_9HYPO|nr:hypothetical protein CEP51_001133 [Fusarium floridanum]